MLPGKSLSVAALKPAFAGGAEITMAPFFFDTASAIVFNPFEQGGGFGDPELSGSPNVVMVPDPTTFRVLPWADRTGWLLADLYMRSGRPFALSPRTILKRAIAQLAEMGHAFVGGLEVEWYLTRIVDPCLDPATLGGPGTPAAARAAALWSALTELALEAAASGGDRKRGDLVEELRSFILGS